METKKYEIKNIRDMVKVTNPENLDNFLTDLKGIISAAHMIKAVVGEQDFDINDMVGESFTWIDDGKHNIDITFEED